MGVIKDQFGNVADSQEALDAIVAAISEPDVLAPLDFKGGVRLG